MTYIEFAEQNKIRMTYKKSVPYSWQTPKPGSYWNVTLKHRNKQLTIKYFMGTTYNRPPEVGEVLKSLKRLTTTYWTTLYSFLQEYGYDQDEESPYFEEAKKTYYLTTRIVLRLEILLGPELIEQLLSIEE